MRRVTPLLLTLALVAASAGCGDDGVFGEGPTTTPPSSVTTAAPTTTAAPPTTAAATTTAAPPTTAATTTSAAATTTAAPTTTTSATTTTVGVWYAPPPFFPDPLPGSDQAAGSGCVPPAGSSTPPDGIWFGYVTGFSPGMLTFDMACFWTGAIAEAKATEDGHEAFDFYIRNMNPATRQIPLSGSTRVWYIDASSGNVSMPAEIPVASWPHPDSFLTCPANWCSVWIFVNNGEVTHLVEQYLP